MEVLEEVELSSAYRAVRGRREGRKAELDSVREEDRRMANWFFDDMVARTLTALRGYARGAENTDSEFRLEVEVADSWDVSALPTLEAALKRRLVQGVLWRWLDLAGLPESETCRKESALAMQEIVRVLCHREAPTRKCKI